MAGNWDKQSAAATVKMLVALMADSLADWLAEKLGDQKVDTMEMS